MNAKLSTRERIVVGTETAVCQYGVGATTVANLLDASGVSRRTFYKHFRSAEDAVAALYHQVTDELVERVQLAMAEATDPLRIVLDAIEAYLDFVVERDPLLAQLHAEAIRSDSLLGPARSRAYDLLVDRVERGVSENLGVKVDPWVWRGLLIAVEGLVIEAGVPFDQAKRDRVRAVTGPMFIAVLAAAPHLPKA